MPKRRSSKKTAGPWRSTPKAWPPGAIVLVRPGTASRRGIIVSGESGVDEAPVTGESTPRPEGSGANACRNRQCDGALRVRVTAARADNTIARVIRLVEEAQEKKRRRSVSSIASPDINRRAWCSSRIGRDHPAARFGGLCRTGFTKGSPFLLIVAPVPLHLHASRDRRESFGRCTPRSF